MPIAANLLRVVFVLFAAAIWGLMFAALDGRGAETPAAVLTFAGAALLVARGRMWIVLGIGTSLVSASLLMIGSASASAALLVNVAGILLVMVGGQRVATGLLRNADASARPAVLGIVGFLVADYAVVHATASDSVSAFALVLPAAALLPLAYGAWRELLEAAAAPARPQGTVEARITA